MGLFSRKGKMGDPVKGSAEVTSIASGEKGEDALIASMTLRLLVYAEGMDPAKVTWKGMVKRHKRPQRGTVLPVTVDRADPERIEVDWDEAPNIISNTLNTIGGSSEMTPEQAKKRDAAYETMEANQDEIMELQRRWQAGEITQDEYQAQVTEIFGPEGTGQSG